MVRDFSPEELSYLATSFAVALAGDMDGESLKVLCSFFVNVVGTLNLIAAQRGLMKGGCGICGGPPAPPKGPSGKEESRLSPAPRKDERT